MIAGVCCSKKTRFLILVLALLTCGCLNIIPSGGKREAVLREDLDSLRNAIDQYTQDKNRAPKHLQDLVDAGYIRAIPKDPFTNSSTTWQVVEKDVMGSLDQAEPGISDVHSGSNQISSEGAPYSRW